MVKKLLLLLFLLLVPVSVFAESAAKIGNTEYETLASAIEAAGDNAEITLLKDFQDTIVVPSSKNITFKLNNHSVVSVENSGKLKIIGPGELKYNIYRFDTIKNFENASVTIDNVTSNVSMTSDYLLENAGTAVLKNITYTNDKSGELIYNSSKGTVTIESGTYSASTMWENHGNMIINGGTFNMSSSTVVNHSYGPLTVNGGNFSNPNGEIFVNIGSMLTINNGVFTGKICAQNYDKGKSSTDSTWNKESIININGGTYNMTDTIFENSTMSSFSTLNINGGNMITTTTDYALCSYGGKNDENKLIITGGTITATNSKGIFIAGDNTLIVGKNDNKVIKDSPIINIPKGNITGLGNKTFNFYDGLLNVNGTIKDTLLTVNVPSGYYIKYDKKSDSSYDAYLVKEGSSDATSTTDNNQVITNKPSNGKKTILDEVISVNPDTGVSVGIILVFIMSAVSIALSLKHLNSVYKIEK